MAYTVNSITYNGYIYKVGDRIRVNNNIMYTSIVDTYGNTISMLSQCTMEIVKIYEGSSNGVAVKNPLYLKWVSGPNGSYNGGGYIRLDQIVQGSGGTPLITTGNYALYAFDTRTNNTCNVGIWAESFFIDWNSFKAPVGKNIIRYELYYQEAPDVNGNPGNWSGSIKVCDVITSNSHANKIIASVNQNTSGSDWGARGFWYRFAIVCVIDGEIKSNQVITGGKRKCLTYPYTFNLNNAGGSPITQYKHSGYTFKMPSAPVRQGYTFTGWSGNGQIYQADQMVENLPDANTTFVARWREKKHMYCFVNGKYRAGSLYMHKNNIWIKMRPSVFSGGKWN